VYLLNRREDTIILFLYGFLSFFSENGPDTDIFNGKCRTQTDILCHCRTQMDFLSRNHLICPSGGKMLYFHLSFGLIKQAYSEKTS